MNRDELFSRAAAIGEEKARSAITARQSANESRARALSAIGAPRLALQPRVVGAAPLTQAQASSAIGSPMMMKTLCRRRQG